MLKSFNVQELVEKKVVPFGNGSIVYTPKKWVGKDVIVVLEEKPLDVRSDALEMLMPFLDKVEGVFLFGSFARNEQENDSDVDILVISSEKISLTKKGRFDFLAKTKVQFLKELKSDKLLFLRNILSEAKPLLNEALLEELRKAQEKPDYKALLDDTVGAFKHVKELLEASKRQGLEILDSNAIVYSLLLRIKGLVIAQCIQKNKPYSKKALFEALESQGFKRKEICCFLEIFKAERDGKKTNAKILLADAERLFEAAKLEFIKTEMLVKA